MSMFGNGRDEIVLTSQSHCREPLKPFYVFATLEPARWDVQALGAELNTFSFEHSLEMC